MRTSIIIIVALLLAACVRSSPMAPTVTSTSGLAGPNRVDLTSADATLFLQSAHTGFMEEVGPTIAAPVNDSPPPRTHRRRCCGPELGERGRSGPIVVRDDGPGTAGRSRPGYTRVAGGKEIPTITVRPQNSGSLRGAFESAYDNNPTVNQARANLRAADEDVAIAKAGNRPTITASVSQGLISDRDVNLPLSNTITTTRTADGQPTVFEIEVSQPLFQGFQVRNQTRQAEANVQQQREVLRSTEQDVLLQVGIAFIDVRRFRDGVRFRTQEVAFLEEQLEAAGARQRFGEGTRTDIDQARTRLAETRAIRAEEESALADAQAQLQRLTGLNSNRHDFNVDVVRLLPGSLQEALERGQNGNPDILGAIHGVDASRFNVKQLEGQALPTVALTGSLATTLNPDEAERNETSQAALSVSIPIYQGGGVSAQVRQAKQELGSARIAVDIVRDDTRADIISAWASVRSSKTAIASAEESVRSAKLALSGVLEELAVGQRTTIDVLNAQTDLIRAQLTRIAAIRERDTAALTILREMGALDIHTLGLNVEIYNPDEYYNAVRDRWGGMRTPDGR